MKKMTNYRVIIACLVCMLLIAACTSSGDVSPQRQQQQQQQGSWLVQGQWRGQPQDPRQVQETREKIIAARSLMQPGDVNDIGYIWMMPRADTLQDLMRRLQDWPQTQALIDILGYADHRLSGHNSEGVLQECFAVMNRIGLQLGLEVGAVKEWGIDAEGTFNAQKPNWDRFIRLGANIGGIVMDEPLVAVMNSRQFSHLESYEERFEFAVEETAEFIRMVRESYPTWFVADIEVYPHFDADFVIQWIDALEARLIEKGVRGQDFFRMDVDWNAMPRQTVAEWEHGWREIKRIEDHCRSIGLPFSQIYWAADAGASARIRSNPARWLDGIMRMGEAYEDAGGMPEQFVIQTWIEEYPPSTLPETEEFSFTHSVLEFNRRFIPPR